MGRGAGGGREVEDWQQVGLVRPVVRSYIVVVRLGKDGELKTQQDNPYPVNHNCQIF